MNRAIVVLLLLIANAIVGTQRNDLPPAPLRPLDYSLGEFAQANRNSLLANESTCIFLPLDDHRL